MEKENRPLQPESSPVMCLKESPDELFEKQNQFIFLELQILVERYKDVLRKLHCTNSYVDSLREENILLASEHLKLLSLVDDQNKSSAASFPEISLSSLPIALGIGRKLGNANHESDKGKEQVTGCETDAGEVKQNSERSTLPKCISIRSSDFHATRHFPIYGHDLSSTHALQTHSFRLQAPATIQDDGREGAVEVEAYSQGTTKTELCNKWVAMGCCPYAERCQFAHGMEELRPVIRHPRYKTQICRMLNATNGCPYGHRCHFKHAATPPPMDAKLGALESSGEPSS